MSEIVKQVVDQHRAIAHMARVLAELHETKAELVAYFEPGMVEFVGRNSARLMELLGDVLNGMDAVDEEEDAWTWPIFREAQRLFPGRAEGSPEAAQVESPPQG